MRNLFLQGERHGALDNSSLENNVAFVDRVRLVEGEGGRVFLTQSGTLLRVKQESCDVMWKTVLNSVVEESPAEGTWFAVTLVDTELVCLSRSGAIVTVNPDTGEANLVGEFQHGIHDGSWSPDREVLVLVTLAEPDEGAEGTPSSVILCMTADFQVLAEIPMEPHNVNEAVHLIWRPDGTRLGVSSVDQADQQRKIRIYQRDPFQLTALGRTEDGSGKLVPNIQSAPLAWAGPGCSQLLACIIPKGRKDLQVAFLEPNGLRHGQFQLRLTDSTSTSVQSIAWNAVSDLLIVHLRQANHDTVQVWSRSNYHWYLKWNRGFREQCSGVTFDEEDPYLLDVVLQTGEWREYKFRLDSSTVDSFGTAVVVDGSQLLVTPLEKALVPPPMAAATLSLSAPVVDIVADAVQLAGEATMLAAVMADDSIAIFSGVDASASTVSAKYAPPTLQAVAKLPHVSRTWRSWCFVGEKSQGRVEFVATQAGSRYGAERLVHMVVSWNSGDERPADASVEVKNEFFLESRLLATVPWCDDRSGVLLEVQDGELLEFSLEEGAILPLEDSGPPLMEPCPWISCLRHPDNLSTNDCHRERLVVGMSERGRLFCHDLLLSDSISSFVLDQKHGFLCLATSESRCELRFIPLAGLVEFDPLSGLDETIPLLRGYEPRHVERGTRVVAVLHKPSVVLQMPRGNLEGIFPRALVLGHCMRHIHAHEFGSSFSLMRRQKVDVNLLVDMDPYMFLKEGCVELIEQIQNIDYLNLFISSLQNFDSTMIRYPIPEWLNHCLERDPAKTRDFDFLTKVNLVCQRMRSVLIEAEDKGETAGGRKVGKGHFLLPILSTFAKEEPPRLEQALSLIKANAVSAHAGPASKPPLFSDSAQHSFQYLAFLAEYELLFNTALGMYDYDIARAVARNSQMDPKFYLPLLNSYRELPKFYGRYQVDVRLKRYECALRNLCESGKIGEEVPGGTAGEGERGKNSFEACFELIRAHKLHEVGIRLFRSTEHQQRILLDLGDMLLESNKANEALNTFLVATPVDQERIMKAARSCWDWRVYFTYAFPQGIERVESNGDALNQDIVASKRQIIARDIAEELEASAQGGSEKRLILAEAARVLLDYGLDVHEAVETLLRGQWWGEAKRIAVMHARTDLKRKSVDAAVSYAKLSIEDLNERSHTFITASKRYEEVLQLRKTAYASGEVDALGLAPGTQEDETGSMFSAATQASNLSGVSRSSTGSTGSVGSISTVISVKSGTSFSLSGADEANRHKSKYNEIGKKAKKKKKKKRGRNRVVPGSEQELLELVTTLRTSLPDNEHVDLLGETVLYLCQENRIGMALELFKAATETSQCILGCQADRRTRETARGKDFLKENPGKDLVQHPCEKEVDSLHFKSFSPAVHDLVAIASLLEQV